MMSRKLIPIMIVALLLPMTAAATSRTFSVRLEIREPVRVELPALGGVAGTGSGSVLLRSTTLAIPHGAAMTTLAVSAPPHTTISVLPPTDQPGAAAPPGYHTVTILAQ